MVRVTRRQAILSGVMGLAGVARPVSSRLVYDVNPDYSIGEQWAPGATQVHMRGPSGTWQRVPYPFRVEIEGTEPEGDGLVRFFAVNPDGSLRTEKADSLQAVRDEARGNLRVVFPGDPRIIPHGV